MAKRFTETTIWEDDWFFELSPEYKLFWFYLKDNCNHAGIWQPKIKIFNAATDTDIDLNKALNYFNYGKQRVRVLESGHWFLEDFFSYQYATSSKTLNLSSKVHESIYKIYVTEKILLSSIKGIDYVCEDNITYTVENFESTSPDFVGCV